MYNYKLGSVFRDLICEYKEVSRRRVLLDKKLPYFDEDFLLLFLNVFNYKAEPKPDDYFMKRWFNQNPELINKTQESFDKLISEMIEGIKNHKLEGINLHDKMYLNLNKNIKMYNNIPISFFRFILIDKEENNDILFHFINSLRFWKLDVKDVSLDEYLSKNSIVELFKEIDEVIYVLNLNYYFINNYFLMNNFKFTLDNFYYKPDTKEASLENYNRNYHLLNKAKYNYIKYILKLFE